MKQEKASEMTEESILNRLRARSSGAVLPVPENNDMAFDEAVTSKIDGWMYGWHTILCPFKQYFSHQDDGLMIMEGCVQWNPIYS